MHYHPSTVQTSTSTRLGTVRLAASPQGLVGLWFDGQRHLPAQLDGPGAWSGDDTHPMLRAAARQLAQYLAGTRQAFDLPLDLSGGTPFQQAVWRALLAIPSGATTSYGALARALGSPTAVRAVFDRLQFRTLLDRTTDCVVMVALPEGVVSDANAALGRLFGA